MLWRQYPSALPRLCFLIHEWIHFPSFNKDILQILLKLKNKRRWKEEKLQEKKMKETRISDRTLSKIILVYVHLQKSIRWDAKILHFKYLWQIQLIIYLYCHSCCLLPIYFLNSFPFNEDVLSFSILPLLTKMYSPLST